MPKYLIQDYAFALLLFAGASDEMQGPILQPHRVEDAPVKLKSAKTTK